MARRNEVLYKDDTSDKMIGGVCSGLAQYFDVDTTLMRVGFVVMAMLGGGGLLGYLILWMVLDPAPAGHWTGTDDDGEDSPSTIEPSLVDDFTSTRPPDMP